MHFLHIHETWFSQLVFCFGKTVFLGRLLFISSDWCQICLVSVKQGNPNICQLTVYLIIFPNILYMCVCVYVCILMYIYFSLCIF